MQDWQHVHLLHRPVQSRPSHPPLDPDKTSHDPALDEALLLHLRSKGHGRHALGRPPPRARREYAIPPLSDYPQLTPTPDQTYQNVHTYNKAGSIGSYFSLLALIPELDIGYTILVAGDPPPGLTMDIAEALTATYFPTLVHVARTQANATYGGTYTYTGTALTSASSNITTPLPSNSTALHAKYPLTNTTAPTPLNSTLTLTVDSGPGLALTRWISNGTDMLYVSVALASNLSSEYWDTLRPSVRLYPTGLEDAVGTNKGGGRKVAFKAVFEDVGGPTFNGTYKADCATWVGVTGAVYGSRPLDLFVFEVDAGGRVVGVENGALRVAMGKVD